MWCHSISQDVTAQHKKYTQYANTQNKHPSDHDLKVRKCLVTIQVLEIV